MKVINLRKQNSGQLRAFFDVVFEDKDGPVLTLRNMKLIETDTGLWPASPGSAYEKKGKQIYEPHFSIDRFQLLDRIGREAAKIYENT